MGIKSKFCAKCGKETASLLSGLCSSCYLAENPLKVPQKLEIKICPKCGAVKQRGIWIKTKEDAEHNFRQLIESKTKLPKGAKLVDVEILKYGKYGKLRLSVAVQGDLIELEKKVWLEINKFACPDCSRQKSEWSAKIQLRTGNKISVDKLARYVRKHKRKLVRVKEVKNGYDLFFFSKASAGKLARKLIKQFKLSKKVSYEQRGHDSDTGKPRHRVVISLR